MIVTQNDIARTDYLERLRGILDGTVCVPSMTLEYSYEPDVMHCHEAELCPMRVFLRRTVRPVPPMSDRAVLTFMRGRLFERFLAQELPSVTRDGISGRVDGLWREQLVETKSTAMDMDKFNPVSSQPHWLQRSKAYCTLHQQTKILLVAWFLIGNMWTSKTMQTGLRCWDLEFTQDELERNWAHMIRQRDLLRAALENNDRPGPAWVKSRLMHYECGDCQFWDQCDSSVKGKRR